MGDRTEQYSQVKTHTIRRTILLIPALALAMIAAITPVAYAATTQQKIDALKAENSETQNAKDHLMISATNLQESIANLQAEIAGIEALIRENQAKDRHLQQEIARFEADLAREREVLGVSVKQMYVENEMTTLEMLASSRDFNEFVDREQHRTAVQSEIGEVMARIETLKAEVDKQKTEVAKLLEDQAGMRSNVDAKRAESAHLLSLNQSQQAAFSQEIAANNSRISELQKQQARENARYNVGKVSYSGSGSYPWANVPYPSSDPDPWGMYKRECVSYTAWKVANSGRTMPYWGGRGNAKKWDENARAAGIPVDTNPQVGDVAISNAGTYGHAMYVESVHGDGTITVSQYNAGWDGRYSVARRSVANLVFIHFR